MPFRQHSAEPSSIPETPSVMPPTFPVAWPPVRAPTKAPSDSETGTNGGPTPTTAPVPAPSTSAPVPSPTTSAPIPAPAQFPIGWPPVNEPTTPSPVAPVTVTSSPVTTVSSSPVAEPDTSSSEPSVFSGQETRECQDAWVYCPGRSKCFTDANFNGGTPATSPSDDDAWGWSIEYNEGDGMVEDCEIWIGAEGCDFSQGTKVGTAILSRELFYFCLDIGEWVSTTFALYSGRCEANDGALHVLETDTYVLGSCEPAEIASNAMTWETFPVIQDGEDTPISIFNFAFGAEVNGAWANSDYAPFPIGTSNTTYVSGYTYACPV